MVSLSTWIQAIETSFQYTLDIGFQDGCKVDRSYMWLLMPQNQIYIWIAK